MPAGNERKRSPARRDASLPDRSKHDQAAFDAERAARMAVGLDYKNIFWLAIIHLGALAAPFTFSWPAAILMVTLWWVTGGIGICLGYHRLFTHRSFATYRPIRWLIALCGTMAGEGSVIHWVANHRKHHALSDKVGDPHSPHNGGWWAHMIWLTPRMAEGTYDPHNRRWAPDLVADPVLRFLDATFVLWHLGFAVASTAIGYYFGGWPLAISVLVWGTFLRMAYVLHVTWLVNSATHMWGYRNYKTRDLSRNLWWVALLTFGEGWHNNHHAYPTMARHGHRWWEIDLTWWTVRAMQACGLAWDVVDSRKHSDSDTEDSAMPEAKAEPAAS